MFTKTEAYTPYIDDLHGEIRMVGIVDNDGDEIGIVLEKQSDNFLKALNEHAALKDKITKMIVGQTKSADLWISQWDRYRDMSGVRNAALAIGKLFGLYHMLCSVDDDVSDEIIEIMRKYNEVWDNLSISKEYAKSLSING